MIAMGMTCNERRGGGGGDKVNRMTGEAIAPREREKKKSIHSDHVCSHCNQSLV